MEMNINLQPGLRGEKTETVSLENTASSWGSGGLEVYATPAMIALMERAASTAIAPLLPEGSSTVGVELNVRHLAATPPGLQVRAAAELLEIDGRRLLFKVEAFDETGKIGEGTHGRFIINNERFLGKASEKIRLKKNEGPTEGTS
jgi:predicted thioesterase